MKRKIEADLLAWKHQTNRKPLLLYGARQVGKTHTALSFGKTQYKNMVYFNLENSQVIRDVFAMDLEPERIVRELSLLSSQSIFPKDTLIFLDEIQACERALTSLKYFCEEGSYHVLAAGSLLGVALNREQYSFPVGKVDMMTLHPLDFEEFLWAINQEGMSERIAECAADFVPFSLHQKALALYQQYLVVGGMPEAVLAFREREDYDYVRAAQDSLSAAYIADMAKYAQPQETNRILLTWRSIPNQLLKESTKFQYKHIVSGARAREFEQPIQWLVTAGVVNVCNRVKEGKLPLAGYADFSAFKLYLADVGLLTSRFDIPSVAILSTTPTFQEFRGPLTENYVMQALVASGLKPYYWANGTNEVDFVLQNSRGEIVPLEVKASDNVRARSLTVFQKRYDTPFSVRISAKNFGYENKLKSVPLYAIQHVKSIIE